MQISDSFINHLQELLTFISSREPELFSKERNRFFVELKSRFDELNEIADKEAVHNSSSDFTLQSGWVYSTIELYKYSEYFLNRIDSDSKIKEIIPLNHLLSDNKIEDLFSNVSKLGSYINEATNYLQNNVKVTYYCLLMRAIQIIALIILTLYLENTGIAIFKYLERIQSNIYSVSNNFKALMASTDDPNKGLLYERHLQYVKFLLYKEEIFFRSRIEESNDLIVKKIDDLQGDTIKLLYAISCFDKFDKELEIFDRYKYSQGLKNFINLKSINTKSKDLIPLVNIKEFERVLSFLRDTEDTALSYVKNNYFSYLCKALLAYPNNFELFDRFVVLYFELDKLNGSIGNYFIYQKCLELYCGLIEIDANKVISDELIGFFILRIE